MGGTGGITGAEGADLVRKQFPEQVVTGCWELESAGRAALIGEGSGRAMCPGEERRHVGRPWGMAASGNEQEPPPDDQ